MMLILTQIMQLLRAIKWLRLHVRDAAQLIQYQRVLLESVSIVVHQLKENNQYYLSIKRPAIKCWPFLYE